MPTPRPVHMPPPPAMIELPNGNRYHVHPGPADLEGYLAPEHVPHLEAGVVPIRVRVTRAGAGYSVNLAPDELESLLRQARLEVLGQQEHPPEPARPRDPARGVGQRDPDAHRLGPNVGAAPDPGHRGTHRRRRKPSG